MKYLIVEPAFLIQEVKERGVRLASPEVEVADLEIAPDCTAVNTRRDHAVA